MNEADACRKYITPKLHPAGWEDDQIREQVTFTDGRIVAYHEGSQVKVNALSALCSSRRLQSATAIHLVFNDGTSYEVYADYPINFAVGLNSWDMEKARKYAYPPMENVLDISVDEA